MMTAVEEMASTAGKRQACEALGVARATFYRQRAVAEEGSRAPTRPRRSSPRALDPEERQAVVEVLHAERFVNKAPREVYAELLDERIFLCSVRTMYRILTGRDELRERRNQLRHPAYPKPQLVASGPNQVWSWDITKLLGPTKWVYYHLYVIVDIFSRYVVGWMVANRESGKLAQNLIEQSFAKQGIGPGRLTVHADRGTAAKSKPVALLMADLGITRSLSRPRVSNDNPFSESQFKTMKYRPEFPDRFGSPEHARAFCQVFFPWYNAEHHHSALGLLTPEVVHYGRTGEVLAVRQHVLTAAWEAHPERFVRKPPAVARPATTVWINPPSALEVGADDTEETH